MRNINFPRLSLFFIITALILSTPITLSAGCGDIDNNGSNCDISDILYLVEYMFNLGSPPLNISDADGDGNGQLDISDLLCFVDYTFNNTLKPSCFPIHSDSSGSCLSGSTRSSSPLKLPLSICLDESETDSVESMEVYLNVHTLTVQHINAYYNCCCMYATEIIFDYENDNLNLTIIESDTTTSPCRCDCYFNFETVVNDIPTESLSQIQVTLIDQYGDTVEVKNLLISEQEYMTAEAFNGNIHIKHYNAFYNCCIGYHVEYTLEENVITAREFDSLNACDCLCYYNLESVLYNLVPGEYKVVLIGGYFETDTIGVDTVIINDDSPSLIGSTKSNCIDDQFIETTSIGYEYSDNILTLNHMKAYYNCGFQLNMLFGKYNDTLRFYEYNKSNDYLLCMCYFDITASVSNIKPGSYIVELYRKNYPGKEAYLDDRRTIELH